MKIQNPFNGKTKLYSYSLAINIIFFLAIIVADILLLVFKRSYADITGIASLGVLYTTLFISQQSEKKREYLPILVYFLSAAIICILFSKNHFLEGSYFYLFPATIGYINSTVNTRNKIKFQFFHLIVFAIASFVLIQYYVSPLPIGTNFSSHLFTFRLIASFLFSALLISHFLLVKVSNNTNAKKITYEDALFHSYMDGYIIYDKDTLEVMDYNESMIHMLDLPDTTNLRGLYFTQVMMRYLADDSPNLELLMNNIPDEWTGEARFITSNKKKFETFVKSFAFTKAGNHLQLVSLRNITEIIKAKEELEIYKEKMEKAAKAKARFLSSMSHELRTPLNGIIGTSNLVLTENNLPEKIKKHINILRYSSEHMLGIINDILDFSKIDAGKLELKKKKFNIKESLDKLVKSFANEYENKKIELNFNYDLQFEKIYVLSDEVKLSQVVANLLSNALKFTIVGRVNLNITIDELTDKNVIVSFEVNDTGIGISGEKHQEIFHDFVQVNNDDGLRRFDGTGLGLTISEKLVTLFGGKLQVESELGKGSRFYFTLNFDLAIEKIITKTERINPDSAPDIRGVRILIVEDNEINAGILRSFLLKWQIRIKEARNGIQALELLKYHKFDLILMDLEMPEMDGYTAIKIIRETNTEIPVIAFTAALLENMDSLISESGFNDYVLKPFRPGELKKKIEYYAPHRKIEYVYNSPGKMQQ